MGFGDIDDLIGDLGMNDEEPPTQPEPGTADLVVVDKEEALFTSCEWTLVATVRSPGKPAFELGRSTVTKQPHTEPYRKRWARQLIRMNVARLRRLGVDVERAYLGWGGAVADLEP